MRISRLLLDADFCEGGLLTLPPEQSHYVRTVLRLRQGYSLTLFNGRGVECSAEIQNLAKESVGVLLGAPRIRDVESPLQLHLAVGISRGERMDFVLQKAVELGIHRVSPLLTEHCVVQLDAAKAKQRHHHWMRIIVSACEQSGRNTLPKLDEVQTFPAWLESFNSKGVILDPQAKGTLSTLCPPREKESITFLSGPEGGFSEREREWAIERGLAPIRLGPRTLRTETATLAIIAATQTLWGDFRM